MKFSGIDLQQKIRTIFFDFEHGLIESGVCVESDNIDYEKLGEVRRKAWDSVKFLIEQGE